MERTCARAPALPVCLRRLPLASLASCCCVSRASYGNEHDDKDVAVVDHKEDLKKQLLILIGCSLTGRRFGRLLCSI